jgi:hypothetical protein
LPARHVHPPGDLASLVHGVRTEPDGQVGEGARHLCGEFVAGRRAGDPVVQHAQRVDHPPNHVIEFDAGDPDRAVCYSSMYTQHYLADAQGGDFFLLRGSYGNHMRRTADDWRIERLIQHVSWPQGNENAVAAARARIQQDRSRPES